MSYLVSFSCQVNTSMEVTVKISLRELVCKELHKTFNPCPQQMEFNKFTKIFLMKPKSMCSIPQANSISKMMNFIYSNSRAHVLYVDYFHGICKWIEVRVVSMARFFYCSYFSSSFPLSHCVQQTKSLKFEVRLRTRLVSSALQYFIVPIAKHMAQPLFKTL